MNNTEFCPAYTAIIIWPKPIKRESLIINEWIIRVYFLGSKIFKYLKCLPATRSQRSFLPFWSLKSTPFYAIVKKETTKKKSPFRLNDESAKCGAIVGQQKKKRQTTSWHLNFCKTVLTRQGPTNERENRPVAVKMQKFGRPVASKFGTVSARTAWRRDPISKVVDGEKVFFVGAVFFPCQTGTKVWILPRRQSTRIKERKWTFYHSSITQSKNVQASSAVSVCVRERSEGIESTSIMRLGSSFGQRTSHFEIKRAIRVPLSSVSPPPCGKG